MHTNARGALVCGVDELPHARDVLTVAVTLARRLDLRLRLVHSAHPDVFLAGTDRRAALQRGAELLWRIGADSDAEWIVELGDPAELLQSVMDEGAELAVVGSRGRGPAHAALAGSVSNAVAASAACPVIVVSPDSATEIAAEPIVACGVDGSPGAQCALEHAASLAADLGGELLAVHVRAAAMTPHATSLMPGNQPFSGSVHEAQAAIATIERPLARLDIDVPTGMRVETGNPARRLATVAAGEPGSLLVVGSRGRNSLRAALFGTVSGSLAASAPVPVMIVPPRACG